MLSVLLPCTWFHPDDRDIPTVWFFTDMDLKTTDDKTLFMTANR